MNSKSQLMRLLINKSLKFKYKGMEGTIQAWQIISQIYNLLERIFGSGYTKNRRNKLAWNMKMRAMS